MTQPARLSPCSPEPKYGPCWSDYEDLASLQRAMRGGCEATGSRTGCAWDTALPLPFLLVLILIELPLWPLVVMVSRARWRADLRRELAAMPPERLPAVLQVVRSEPRGAGRSIAESILRQMGIPAEVIPAPSPGGNSGELSAG